MFLMTPAPPHCLCNPVRKVYMCYRPKLGMPSRLLHLAAATPCTFTWYNIGEVNHLTNLSTTNNCITFIFRPKIKVLVAKNEWQNPCYCLLQTNLMCVLAPLMLRPLRQTPACLWPRRLWCFNVQRCVHAGGEGDPRCACWGWRGSIILVCVPEPVAHGTMLTNETKVVHFFWNQGVTSFVKPRCYIFFEMMCEFWRGVGFTVVGNLYSST